MLLRELFLKEAEAKKEIELGRPFNHPEHWVIFHGVSGINEALDRFIEMSTEKAGNFTVRFKWDGNPQIYWGREKKNGPLVLAGHNGWGKGGRGTGTTMNDFTSPDAVKNFILNKSGEATKGQEITPERQRFAEEFSNLYPVFDAATPKDFVGFVYADAIFLPSTKGQPDKNGVFNFHPNPHSDTEYHVKANSPTGKRVANAAAMVAAHAFFKEFGAPDKDQIPMKSFSHLNQSPGVIVLDPIYNGSAPQFNQTKITELRKAKGHIDTYGKAIDAFVHAVSPQDKNGIFYPFLNQQNAAGTFDNITAQTFFDWMSKPLASGKSRVSGPKQQALLELEKQHHALGPMFHIMKEIRHIKHEIVDIVNGQQNLPEGFWATASEGYVQYADAKHKHGHMKLVAPGWKK